MTHSTSARVLVIALVGLIFSAYYYWRSIEQIPVRIAESDETMLMADSMRHTFKVIVLNYRGLGVYLTAIRTSDEDLVYDALDFMEASLGFVYSGYIDNDELIEKVVPLIRKNISIVNTNMLAIDDESLKKLRENMNSINIEAGKVEKSIWVNFQRDFVQFQSNEYRIQTIYEIAAILAVSLAVLLSVMFIKQRKLIKALVRQEEKLYFQAQYDELTELPNRSLVFERFSEMKVRAQNDATKIALLFIDFDNFKQVNDSLGHETGDLLLQQAAMRLKDQVGSKDIAGRLGGDEFVVLISDIKNDSDVIPMVKSLVTQFQEGFVIDDRELMLTASIGVSMFPDNSSEFSVLLRGADSAMYHAKGQGRNTFSFFTDKMNEQVLRRFELEEKMYGALQRKEFYVVFQPKVNIGTGKIRSAEALLRWENPELGQVYPDEFIPIAEQTGLIVDIGKFVLTEAIDQAVNWRSTFDIDFSIAVNISPRQLRDPDFLDILVHTLSKSNLSERHLELEITEGVLIDGHLHTEQVINEISKKGVQLAMDDFGTGYSSLSYLRKYPFDVLKIDRSFINDICENKMDKDLVGSAIAMAKSLNLKVVAEGVETKEQLEMLKSFGCDYAQGYLLSKPVLPQNMSQIIASSM